MNDRAVSRHQIAPVHLEAAGGGIDQHFARRRPGLAQLLPRIGHGGGTAGALGRTPEQIIIEPGIGGGESDPNGGGVHLQLLGHQHRQAGGDALAHFQMLDHHRDLAVGADGDEGIGDQIGRPGGAAGGGGDGFHRRQGQADTGAGRQDQEAAATGIGGHGGQMLAHVPPPSR